MGFEIYYAVPGLIGAAIVLTILGMVLRYSTASPARGPLLILSVAAFVYVLADGLARLSAAGGQPVEAAAWQTVRFFGIAIVPAALLHFATVFAGVRRVPWFRPAIGAAYAFSLVFIAVRVGTPWIVEAVRVEGMTVYAIVGPGFPAFVGYGILCTAVAVWLFGRGARSADTKLARSNATKGWVGAVLPFAASAVFIGVSRGSATPVFDPIVPFISFSVVLYAGALLNQQIPAASLSAIREIFASLPDGLVVVNRAGLVTFANAEAVALLGRATPGVEGNEIAAVLKGAPLPVEARARIEFAYAEVNTGQRDTSAVTFELTDPKPRTLTAVVGSTHVGSQAGIGHGLGALSVTDRYTFIVLHDETDSRAKEAALSRANEVKDLFISMIGHDLKAPLNAITGYSELVALDSQSSPDALAVYRYAQAILGSARQIHLMMENARTFSRLVDPQDILRAREQIDLGALVQREAANLKSAADRKLIRVAVEAEPATPGPQVFAAPILRSVFQNVIDNAIKYAPEKSTVSVRFRPREGAVDVEVEDEGLGIPPDKREAVFKRYTRLEQTRAKTEGLGLGLAISRQIVELHGGTLTVHDRSDGATGALFRVHLPRGAAR